MPTYAIADGKIHGAAMSIMKKHHGELFKAKVSFTVLMAEPNKNAEGDPIGIPLKIGGLEVLLITRIIGLKDRTKGSTDVEIVLNGPAWEEASAAEQRALLDHALSTFTLARDAEGTALEDALGRPRLRRAPPTHALGWYPNVAERWGEDAPAVRVLRQIQERSKQMAFAFKFPEVQVGADEAPDASEGCDA